MAIREMFKKTLLENGYLSYTKVIFHELRDDGVALVTTPGASYPIGVGAKHLIELQELPVDWLDIPVVEQFDNL